MYFPSNPVEGYIHPSSWDRPAGSMEPEVSQYFGPTSYEGEPKVSWPGGEGIAPAVYTHFHRGLDITQAPGNADLGKPILAAAAGIVVRDGMDPTSGNAIRVRLDHGNGWHTKYYHLQKEIVSLGQAVKAGQLIGHMGTTGWSTAVHLHFMVEFNGKVMDPWRRLLQNVTCHPTTDGVNIRSSKGSGTTLGPVYAKTTKEGRVRRVSDGADLGPYSTWRKFGDYERGASYGIDDRWGRVWIDGAWRYVAAPYLALSV